MKLKKIIYKLKNTNKKQNDDFNEKEIEERYKNNTLYYYSCLHPFECPPSPRVIVKRRLSLYIQDIIL